MSYLNTKGRTVPEKKVRIEDCQCKFECPSHITAVQQQTLFAEFRSMKTRAEQRAYLASLIVSNPPKRHRTEEPKVLRQRSAAYHLKDAAGEDIRVCREFFCATFAISRKITSNIVKKKSPGTGRYDSSHGNKGRVAPNITSPRRARDVMKHLSLVPKVPSHYCRKKSKKLYFEATLNRTKLYKLYKEWTDVEPVSYSVYVRILNEHEPKTRLLFTEEGLMHFM